MQVNMFPELHTEIVKYLEAKYGSETLDAALNDPVEIAVDYHQELTRFTQSLAEPSLAFAFFKAKESRQKGDFNNAMLMVSEIVRDHVTALRDIQHLFDELRGDKPRQVVFEKFRQFEPLEVGLKNAPDVLKMLKEFISPWKTERATLIAAILAVERQLDLEQKKMNVLERIASTAEDSRESDQHRKNLEAGIKEQAMLRYGLGTAITDITFEILKKMAPDLSPSENIKYQLRLMRSLNLIALSDIRTKAAKEVDV